MSTLSRYAPTLRVSTGLALLAAVYLVSITMVGSSAMQLDPAALSLAVVVDLTLTAAVILYLFFIRPGTLPKKALIPLLAIGLFTASRILPARYSMLLTGLAVLGGALELLVAGALLLRWRRLLLSTRAALRRGEAAWPALMAGFAEALGERAKTLGAVAAQEGLAVYYALFGWMRRLRWPADAQRFGHHRAHAWSAIVLALVILSVPEGMVLHMALDHFWSPLAALVVSALHVYGLLWLIGDCVYMRRTALVLTPAGRLRIDVGFRLHIDLHVDEIAAIGEEPEVLADAEHTCEAKVVGAPNLFLRLRSPHTATMIMGRSRQVTGVALRVEQPEAVCEAVRAAARHTL